MKKLKKILDKVANYLVHVLTDLHILKEDEPEPTWTKESSFALVIAADYKMDTYPVTSVNKIRDEIMSNCADTVRFIVDQDATAQAFLDALKEGIQYKTFFFYENAHGNNKSIRMIDRHLFSKEIWEVIRTAKNRIVGFFDSCYSGSMIEDPEQQAKNMEDKTTMADYLIKMFEEQSKNARGDEKQPQIRLYSACENGMMTVYEPESSTKFGYAMLHAYKKTPEDATYADFDKMLIEKGSYKCSFYVNGQTLKQNIVPQIASYGEDFSNYEKFK